MLVVNTLGLPQPTSYSSELAYKGLSLGDSEFYWLEVKIAEYFWTEYGMA